jgi:hypothetical protein
MPLLVKLRVKDKRSSPVVHERHPIAKKQRTTRISGAGIPSITDGRTSELFLDSLQTLT